MRLPWWLRKLEEDGDEPRVLGEPGDGRVLVVTRRDAHGDVVERTWVDPASTSHWEERVWRDTP